MSRSVVTELRDLTPIRPLTRHEALGIAERQAFRFHHLIGIDRPAVPEAAIADLPRLQVEHLANFPVSGATHWSNGRWLIVLNKSEPTTRQRFSLAHEFKHIIDHRFVDLIYASIEPARRDGWTEQLCDYFAGCLLMPRPWLKRAFTTRTQDVHELAALFDVSTAAMTVRLTQIGLLQPIARCDVPVSTHGLRRARQPGSSGTYRREGRMLAPAGEVMA